MPHPIHLKQDAVDEGLRQLCDELNFAASSVREKLAAAETETVKVEAERDAIRKEFIQVSKQCLALAKYSNRVSERLLDLFEAGKISFEEATAP